MLDFFWLSYLWDFSSWFDQKLLIKKKGGPVEEEDATNHQLLEMNQKEDSVDVEYPDDLPINPVEEKLSFSKKVLHKFKHVYGLMACLIAGSLFAMNNVPPFYLLQRSSIQRSFGVLDYVFSHYSGIMITASTYFFIYALVKKNSPFMNIYLFAPAFVSGCLWATCQIILFVAFDELGFAIAFPVAAVGPGIIASAIGILYYKEIKGRRNFTFFLSAFGISLVGMTMIAFSK